MKRIATIATLLLLSVTAASPAQEKGYWKAISKTAQAITGDISFSGDKLILNFAGFTIAQIRPVDPSEVNAVFNSDTAATKPGNLYRLSIPADKRFLHKNTLCGTEETQYMLTSQEGKSLQVAFFSGSKMPDLKPESVVNSTSLCGTYLYSR